MMLYTLAKKNEMVKQIIKSSGTIEPFSAEKLLESIRSAGASDEQAKMISRSVVKHLDEISSTKSIYDFVLANLKKMPPGIAARYNLRRALADLGPSGFPFEKFIAELFSSLGYKTQTNQTLTGECVDHEIDVLLRREAHKLPELVEAKFHNQPGIRSGVQTALYMQARFQDLANQVSHVWLVTNTKFSGDAIKYGECKGMKLLSWDYPKNKGLGMLIRQNNVHPITALTTLKPKEKIKLIESGIVLVRQLVDLQGQSVPSDAIEEAQSLIQN